MSKWSIYYPTWPSRLLFRLGYRDRDFDKWRSDVTAKRVIFKKLNLWDRFVLKYLCPFPSMMDFELPTVDRSSFSPARRRWEKENS